MSFKMLQRPLFYVNRAVPERILPILVNYLRDNNNQVRKTSQAALLVLLEQGMRFVICDIGYDPSVFKQTMFQGWGLDYG